ncbi:hypothetical protein [Polyangium sp. 6x1]|uniref:hypothetical protein n=1 Tax=Polyangium sp. 6x1 TaxID=3042689 RepID=UPI002482B496|nr:hypothetical protein [Polyangium sp. 6x1]MDI1452200.1 hypothetical protein [Polyangium sp. 6x1]
MRRAMLILAGLVIVGSSVRTAEAQEKDKKPRGAITLSEVTITGRIEKPIAAVDVSRIQPKLTLAELRQPFLDRIEEAIFKDPF